MKEITCKKCGTQYKYLKICPSCGTKHSETFITNMLFGTLIVIAVICIYQIRRYSNIPIAQPAIEHTENLPKEKRKQTYDRVFKDINEKVLLRDSYFGDFKKGKKIKRTGSVYLKRWSPQLEWAKKFGRGDVLLEGVDTLHIKYDEVWKVEDVFDSPENKYKGQYDKYTLYWKRGMVQASTLEKYYLSDPSTGQPLYPPSHKIVSIFDREFILKKLSE